MASYTTNSRGQRQYKPGTSVTTTTSGLQSSIDAARGIVSILFEASKGGEPLVPRTVTSSGELKSILPADLANLWSKLCFSPGKPGSSPNRTLGGVSRIVLCRVNPATQAAYTLQNSDGDCLTIKSADWGLFGNEIQVKVETGSSLPKKFTAKYDGEEYSVEGGSLPMFSLVYASPSATPPASWAIGAMAAVIDPNAADGSAAVTVNYNFTGPAGTTIDPRTWMAFDGPITIAIGAQTAGASRDFVITGVLKEDYGAKVAGDTDSETITVSSAGSTTSARSWSEISIIDMPGTLDGNATYTGAAFALTKATSTGAPTYTTINSVLDRINQKTARGFLASSLSVRTPTFLVSDMDKYTSTSILTTASFSANLFDLMEKINANVDIVEAERATGATGVPANVAYTNLVGGADGTTTNTDWENALAAIEDVTVNEVVPWTTDASINELVLNHCNEMTLLGKGERYCALSVPLATARGTSAGQLYALSLAINARLATIHCQGLEMYNESGVATEYDPRACSLLCAALAAGRNPGYGITWAPVNGVLNIIEKPGSGATDWTAKANAEELIEHGYELLEKTRAGIRVARGCTSYQGTEPQYSSRLAVESTLLATTTLRESLEVAIGQSTTVPIAALKELCKTVLNRLVANGIIVRWDADSLVITEVNGEKVVVDVNVTVAAERLWVDVTLNLSV